MVNFRTKRNIRTKKSIFSGKSKKMEFKNSDTKGKEFSFESRMRNAETMPETTFGRVMYRGTAVIAMGNHRGNNVGGRQRTFILNTPGRIGDYHWTQGEGDLHNRDAEFNDLQAERVGLHAGLRGYPAYWAQWGRMYRNYMCLGSTFNFRITPPVYPSAIILPNKAPSKPSPGTLENTNISQQFRGDRTTPNASCGFFYMRHCYFQKRPGSQALSRVGHPMYASGEEDVDLWPNLRSFLNDKSVSWKRDELPKISVTAFTVPVNTAGNDARIAEVSLGNATSVTYSAEFSKKPVFFTAKYSMKQHRGVEHVMSEGNYTTMEDTFEKDTPRGSIKGVINANYAEKLYRVRLGYIAFDATGSVAFMVPIDNQIERNIEVEARYFCAFKGPRVEPFGDKNLNDGVDGNEDSLMNQVGASRANVASFLSHADEVEGAENDLQEVEDLKDLM